MRTLLPVLMLALAALAGCAGGESPVNSGGGEIGAEGGIVTSDDGRLTLDVPAGALSEPTSIRIDTVAVDGVGTVAPTRSPRPDATTSTTTC